MPVNSAIVAFIISFVWFIVHYLTTKFELLPNSDISEISIAMGYTLYILLYVKVISIHKNRRKDITIMNSEFYEEVPVLSREEAIAILNTPNDELNTLIDRAKNLRYKRRFF